MRTNIVIIAVITLIIAGLAICAGLRVCPYLSGRGLMKEDVIAEVNGYKITEDDFTEELNKTKLMYLGTGKDRQRIIMDNLVNNAVILKEAQKMGIDKDEDFVKTVERFWRQSLIRLTLQKKIDEIRKRGDIKTKEEEEEALQEWLNGLRNKAKVKIYDERFEYMEETGHGK